MSNEDSFVIGDLLFKRTGPSPEERLLAIWEKQLGAKFKSMHEEKEETPKDQSIEEWQEKFRDVIEKACKVLDPSNYVDGKHIGHSTTTSGTRKARWRYGVRTPDSYRV